jgi:hypothetical protein
MKSRLLKTVEEIVDAIGRERLYEIAECASNNVTNWLAAGKFPPDTYVVIQAELKRLRFSAPLSLWRMREPKKARAAA